MVEKSILKVKNSPVKVGGRARVNPNIKMNLDLDNGGLVIVSSETKDVLVSIFFDDLVDDGKIVLRKEDRKKLNINEGESVRVRKHKSLLNKLL
ncbi:MAG: hypothetical protein R6W73_06890 [Candidatus Saliniplasma sp.]